MAPLACGCRGTPPGTSRAPPRRAGIAPQGVNPVLRSAPAFRVSRGWRRPSGRFANPADPSRIQRRGGADGAVFTATPTGARTARRIRRQQDHGGSGRGLDEIVQAGVQAVIPARKRQHHPDSPGRYARGGFRCQQVRHERRRCRAVRARKPVRPRGRLDRLASGYLNSPGPRRRRSCRSSRRSPRSSRRSSRRSPRSSRRSSRRSRPPSRPGRSLRPLSSGMSGSFG
jgi:hypothetical protein